MNALARIAVAALLLALVAGCASKPAQPASSPPPTASAQSDVPPPLVPAMPLPANAVDNAVAKLDGIAGDLMKKSGIPGMAVAVVHGGKTVYAKGFGVKDVKTGRQGGRRHRLPAGVGVQIAGCDGRGARGRDPRGQLGHARSSSKLPWFALSDPVVTPMVTVGDMFAHRSGLPDHAGDMLEDLGYDRRHVLEQLRQLPLDPFRISYAYTNFGLTAGAEAVAVNAGKSWEDLADEALVPPARHDIDELPVHRLHSPSRPRRRPYPRRRALRTALCPRRRRRSPRWRGEFFGERHDALADDDAGQRQP